MENRTMEVRLIPSSYLRGKIDPYDPFLWYEEMRKQTPVYYNDKAGMWNVFLYKDVKRVLEDKEFFSNVIPQRGKSSLSQSIIAMDPPKHTDIRSIVSRSFTPKVMREWESRIHEIASELLNSVQGQSEFDIVNDFSYPLPVIVIAEMLGVPSSEMKLFKDWSDTLVSSPENDHPEHLAKFKETRNRTEAELSAFFEQIIEEKRAHPGNDLISILIKAKEEEAKLSSQELIAFCNLLLVAGNETTTNLISNAVYSLIEHKQVFEQVKHDPALVPQLVEETLRYRSPAQVIIRRVKQDTELGNNKLKKGEIVMAWIGSANRDENQFENAHVFDIHRKPNHHLAFGQGIHFCLGAPLARLEANIALTSLLQRVDRLSWQSDRRPVPIGNSTAIYGLKKLPVSVK
ncbi:cytochrome P450 [Bacillus methanolicus]|uniref:cytochrome P450 n=1 Tax=Bacillus methanolicus TaxID=1471 RepID=UPI00200DB7C4|nr:cytochrome P450 [Bacillus methanolicus]UQD53138.1 cytochrome P450 [Bacillus methanolicus]